VLLSVAVPSAFGPDSTDATMEQRRCSTHPTVRTPTFFSAVENETLSGKSEEKNRKRKKEKHSKLKRMNIFTWYGSFLF